MNMLQKKGAMHVPMGIDDLHGRRPYSTELEREGKAGRDEGSGGLDRIPVKGGRALVEVSHRGAMCYRLEKTRCGKKSCRCARGELHGPYWYAYYREDGRMRCEYIGKSLPEDVSLENRARKACKSSQALRERAAKTVGEVQETLKKLGRLDEVPKPAESKSPKGREGIYKKEDADGS